MVARRPVSGAVINRGRWFRVRCRLIGVDVLAPILQSVGNRTWPAVAPEVQINVTGSPVVVGAVGRVPGVVQYGSMVFWTTEVSRNLYE